MYNIITDIEIGHIRHRMSRIVDKSFGKVQRLSNMAHSIATSKYTTKISIILVSLEQI